MIAFGILNTALAAAALLFPPVAAAGSDFFARTLTAEDAARLERFAETREAALHIAREGGNAAEVARLERLLDGATLPILGVDIRGDYRCRYARLDGLLPLVVHGWFDCVIGEDDIGYRLEKTSGSQRITGHFIDAGEAYLVFWGASHHHREPPRAYGDDPERNIVGRFVKVGERRYRLEIPPPLGQSRFDMLELRPRG